MSHAEREGRLQFVLRRSLPTVGQESGGTQCTFRFHHHHSHAMLYAAVQLVQPARPERAGGVRANCDAASWRVPRPGADSGWSNLMVSTAPLSDVGANSMPSGACALAAGWREPAQDQAHSFGEQGDHCCRCDGGAPRAPRSSHGRRPRKSRRARCSHVAARLVQAIRPRLAVTIPAVPRRYASGSVSGQPSCTESGGSRVATSSLQPCTAGSAGCLPFQTVSGGWGAPMQAWK